MKKTKKIKKTNENILQIGNGKIFSGKLFPMKSTKSLVKTTEQPLRDTGTRPPDYHTKNPLYQSSKEITSQLVPKTVENVALVTSKARRKEATQGYANSRIGEHTNVVKKITNKLQNQKKNPSLNNNMIKVIKKTGNFYEKTGTNITTGKPIYRINREKFLADSDIIRLSEQMGLNKDHFMMAFKYGSTGLKPIIEALHPDPNNKSKVSELLEKVKKDIANNKSINTNLTIKTEKYKNRKLPLTPNELKKPAIQKAVQKVYKLSQSKNPSIRQQVKTIVSSNSANGTHKSEYNIEKMIDVMTNQGLDNETAARVAEEIRMEGVKSIMVKTGQTLTAQTAQPKYTSQSQSGIYFDPNSNPDTKSAEPNYLEIQSKLPSDTGYMNVKAAQNLVKPSDKGYINSLTARKLSTTFNNPKNPDNTYLSIETAKQIMNKREQIKSEQEQLKQPTQPIQKTQPTQTKETQLTESIETKSTEQKKEGQQTIKQEPNATELKAIETTEQTIKQEPKATEPKATETTEQTIKKGGPAPAPEKTEQPINQEKQSLEKTEKAINQEQQAPENTKPKAVNSLPKDITKTNTLLSHKINRSKFNNGTQQILKNFSDSEVINYLSQLKNKGINPKTPAWTNFFLEQIKLKQSSNRNPRESINNYLKEKKKKKNNASKKQSSNGNTLSFANRIKMFNRK